jgi:hypothetical protein
MDNIVSHEELDELLFVKSVPACCFLRGNGHDQQPMPKTSSRKRSSSSGGETGCSA